MMRILIISCICMPMHAWFEHGRAVNAAHSGDWQRAHTLLTTELVNHPHDPSVVYDAGVAAYKTGDYEQARAYFDHVISLPQASDQLKERAYFNAGNTQVALKQFEQAIKKYEQALSIDPHDEHARHNLEIVKKMLEQQKQEQDKQEKENEEKENKEQQDESSEESESESGSDEQQGESKQEKNKEQADTKNSDAQKKERDQKKQEAQKQQTDKKQKEEQQQQSVAQEKDKRDKKESEKAAAQQSAVKLDKQLLRLLEQQEKHDADINKQMIKATVGSHKGDAHDKHCW
ncbi:MAG: tetratricopeptide repeat protein [Candidatus Babeliales bacterium]